MVTVDDIADILKTRVEATTGFATRLPGGWWFDRGPDAPDGYPFAVVKVEFGRPNSTSGSKYTQTATIRIAVYGPVGLTGVDIALTQQFIATAVMSDAALTAFRAASLRNSGDKIISVTPAAPRGNYDQAEYASRDVFVCGATAEMLVQGDRGTA